MFVVNMTAYLASASQRELGVIDVEQDVSHAIREKLMFLSCPSVELMQLRANELADIAENLCARYDTECVLVYAKTFFLHILVSTLHQRGIRSYATYAPKVVTFEKGEVNRKYTHTDLICCVPSV